MKTFFKTIYGLLIAAVITIGLLLVTTMLPIPGNVMVKIVKSGSMEPAIKTGGIVVIRAAVSYDVGDIITFGEDTKTQIPTTHRIVGIDTAGAERRFLTKGDANNAPDPVTTPASDVRGKVIFTMPYAGYVLDFARTKLGFILIVGIPALLLIFDEIRKVVREVRKMRRPKGPPSAPGDRKRFLDIQSISTQRMRQREEIIRQSALLAARGFGAARRKRIGAGTIGRAIFAMVALCGTAGLLSVGSTVSYYRNAETTTGNSLEAAEADIEVVPQRSGLRTASIVDEEPPATDIDSTSFSVSVISATAGSLLAYSMRAQLDGESPAACDELVLDAAFGDSDYSGPLVAFAYEGLDTLDDVSFTIAIPDGSTIPDGALCSGDIVFGARLAEGGDQLEQPFSDSESYPFSVQRAAALIPTVVAPEPLVEPSEESLEETTELVDEEPLPEETDPTETVQEEPIAPSEEETVADDTPEASPPAEAETE